MSFVIGTAGHVDHGKTTLVHALTGVRTDRLEAERRRGITIELGFAPLDLGGGLAGSLVDVPGHRRFVPTMIAGASGIDLVLLVVAADESVMPQTREHLAVCELLDLREGIVALTKTDRVDEETRALAEEEIRELLDGRLDATIVPCAPPHGTGIERLRLAIASALRAREARKNSAKHARGTSSGPPRLWVDRVFHVRGAGTVLTGTLTTGRVSRGDTLAVVGARGARELVVRALHVHGAPVDHADAPTRLAINAVVDAAARGDLVTCKERAPEPSSTVDASYRGAALRRGAHVGLHVGTAHVAAEVVRLEPLAHAEQLVRLALAEPRAIAGGDRYVLRGSRVDARSGALLGGGIVLDACPHVRSRRGARRALAEALRAGDGDAALAVLLSRDAPRSIDPACVALSVDRDRLVAVAEGGVARGELVRCAEGRVVQRASVRGLAERARTLVLDFAASAPLDRGLPLATLKQQLAELAGGDVADAAILMARAQRGAADVDAIVIDGDVVVPAARRGRIPSELAGAVTAARTAIRDAGIHGVSLASVGQAASAPQARARTILAVLERDGTAVRAADLWFARTVIEVVRDRAIAHLRTFGTLDVLAFKALTGLPRRQAILLLESFDAAGLTRRTGNTRVLARHDAQDRAPRGAP